MRAPILLLLASCSGQSLAPDELHLGYGFGDGTSDFEGSRADFDTDARLYSVGLTWHLSADISRELMAQQARTMDRLMQERAMAQSETSAWPRRAPPYEAPVAAAGDSWPVDHWPLMLVVMGAVGLACWALLTDSPGRRKKVRAWAKRAVRPVRRR